MLNKEYIVSVDIGSSKIAAAVGKKTEDGQLEILAVGQGDTRQGVIRGELRNIEMVSRAIAETVAAIEGELGIRVRETFVGISGQHIKCFTHSGYVFNDDNIDGDIKPKDVQRLNDSMRNVQTSLGETVIQILPQSYNVDSDLDVKEPVGMIGKKLEGNFNIVIGEKDHITRVEKALSKIDIRVCQLIPNVLASAEAVLVDDEKELGVAVIDIGAGTTDVCIFHDNKVRHIGVIPIGSNSINKDIRGYGILEKHVEDLKVKYGHAVSALAPGDRYISIQGMKSNTSAGISFKTLASIIEARMRDIIDCAVMEIEKSGYMGRLGAGIVLTGGAVEMEGIDELFKRHTGYTNIRLARPEINLTPGSAGKAASPVFSSAIGLLIKGMNSGKVSIVEIVEGAAAPANPAPASAANPVAPATPKEQPQASARPQTINSKYAGAGAAAGAGHQSPPQPPVPPQDDDLMDDPDGEFETPEGEGEEGTEKPPRKNFFGALTGRIKKMVEVIDDNEEI